MSDQRSDRRDDHEQLDTYPGVALLELEHYQESPDATIADLERALSALRQGLVCALASPVTYGTLAAKLG